MRTLFILLLLVSSGYAQIGKEVNDFREYDDHSKSLVLLEVSSYDLSGHVVKRGSGVIVNKTEEEHPEKKDFFKAEIITATHVIEDASEIRVMYQGGGEHSAEIEVAMDPQEGDIAILTTYVPKHVPSIEINNSALESLSEGDTVYLMGYGHSEKEELDIESPRYFVGKFKHRNSETLAVDALVTGGDSGGAILNQNGELLGIISGGSAWYDRKIMVNDKEKTVKFTWPTRAGHVKLLHKMRFGNIIRRHTIKNRRLPENPPQNPSILENSVTLDPIIQIPTEYPIINGVIVEPIIQNPPIIYYQH